MSAKQQKCRPKEEIQRDNAARLRRMDAWIGRARAFCLTDADGPALVESPIAEDALAIGVHAQFIFWWIALEAGYAREGAKGEALGTRWDMEVFIRRAMKRDIQVPSWSTSLSDLKESATAFIELPPASQSYWSQKRNAPVLWEKEFHTETEKAITQLKRAASGDLKSIAGALQFLLKKRMYTVRNQIFHGGSSLDGSYGRPQVELCVKLLSTFVPKFRHTIFCNPEVDWKTVPYPRQEPKEKWPVKIPQ